MAKAIMVQGTASGVGKTILTLALCRIFKNEGYSVAPFKAQNMTSNTTFTDSGHEIAVSQWLQATAAGITADGRMNPVLLKYSTGKKGTDVIVSGKYFDTINAHKFKEMKNGLVAEIMNAYNSLSKQYDILVIEGAGSPVELNLNKDDVVNMGMAKRAKAPVILVADVDRGGVFSSIYGTLQLLDKSERGYVKSVIVNRFRGDISSFGDGVGILERITGLPVVGVVPYVHVDLPEEDKLYNGGNSASLSDPFIESKFDDIADTVQKSLNMNLVYEILNKGVGANI